MDAQIWYLDTWFFKVSFIQKNYDVSCVNSASIVNFQLRNVGHWRSYFTYFSSKKSKSSIFTWTFDSMFCLRKKLPVNWNMGVPKTLRKTARNTNESCIKLSFQRSSNMATEIPKLRLYVIIFRNCFQLCSWLITTLFSWKWKNWVTGSISAAADEPNGVYKVMKPEHICQRIPFKNLKFIHVTCIMVILLKLQN
jgi:hypothetical protein